MVVIFLPFLGVLVFPIANGDDMQERWVDSAVEAQRVPAGLDPGGRGCGDTTTRGKICSIFWAIELTPSLPTIMKECERMELSLGGADMHEAELANMTQRQLVETLSALLLRYEQDTWTIDDAGLIAEIRDELADRDYSTSLLDELRLVRSH